MNCLFQMTSYSAAILRRTRCVIPRSSTLPQSYPPSPLGYLGVKTANLGLLPPPEFRLRSYYSSKSSSAKKTRSQKVKSKMEPDKNEFFVVRKGDVVGVYTSLTECQAQVGSLICHPPVSVFKGHKLGKDTKEYLVSHGLTNALYTIRAADLTEDLFGELTPCHFQDPASLKRSIDSETEDAVGSSKHIKLDNADSQSCIIEFDGAAKKNPGPAGAGAVLRTGNGNLICKLREGLGITTNNVAEYRALILGLRYALDKGYTDIEAIGDSKLVCMQVSGKWKAKHPNISAYLAEAKKLVDQIPSFRITHVLRGSNSEADAQANLAVKLDDGKIVEDCAISSNDGRLAEMA